MNVYGTEQIRNVVLLGHGGAGKTTVAEAMALITGVTKRMGKVADGNTISDYDKEEIKRQFSISTTLIPLEYQGENGPVKINLLDTPGFFDFVGEVEEAISVADAAIIVVNCKAGIEPGTERAWEMCEKYNLPRLIFVTNMDDDHASYRELVVKLEKKFGRKIAPFQLPIRENEKFVGFVNVVKMAGRRFTNLSDYVECEIPDYVQKNLTIARDALIEAVAETSEEYMERYFLGEEFTQEEIRLISDYEISAGYMLINLKCIREDNKQIELTQFFHNNLNRLILPEQDCIALCCAPYLRFMPYKYVVCAFQFHEDPQRVKFNPNNASFQDKQVAIKAYNEMREQVVQLHYPGREKPWNSPFVYKYKEWLTGCHQANQLGYYLLMQPLFFTQRLKKYSLSRFIRKIKKKYHG